MRAGLITLILLFGVYPALAQEGIDLPQAINYALSQNKELVRTALTVDLGQLREAHASVEFDTNIRPDVMTSFSGGQDFLRYGPRISKKLEGGTVLNMSAGVVTDFTQGNVHNRGSMRFQIEQPIFRNLGSLIHREPLLQAASGVKTARRKYELRKADLVLEVVKTYENILRLQQQVRADQASFKRNHALYRVTKAKEGLGKTTRVDTLRVELLRGQAKVRLEASQERLAWAQKDFAELLGFPPDKVFDLQASPVLELQLLQPSDAVKTALANRLDYAQVFQDHHDAVRAVHIADRMLLPDVRVTASYDDFATSPTSFGAIPLDRKLWFFGLSSPTDFNLGRERIALDQARVSQRSALQAIEIIERTIARQALQQTEVYRRAQADLGFAKQNFALTEARMKLAKQRFTIGRGDNFTVTDAETAFLEAERVLLAAQADASIAGYELTRTLGTIVEVPEELKPLRAR